jgi:hypothetical protein
MLRKAKRRKRKMLEFPVYIPEVRNQLTLSILFENEI